MSGQVSGRTEGKIVAYFTVNTSSVEGAREQAKVIADTLGGEEWKNTALGYGAFREVESDVVHSGGGVVATRISYWQVDVTAYYEPVIPGDGAVDNVENRP